MKKIYTSVLLSILFLLPCYSFLDANDSVKQYLDNRVPESNHRYKGYYTALKLMKERKVKVLVETGTARFGDKDFQGDGGSTVIFGDWASKNNAILFTVDILPLAVENARNASTAYAKNIRFTCGDSVKFLKEFKQAIDFLYLDSFDFDFNNPDPSQRHHLKEIKAAYSKLHKNSVVMIDDCDLPHGGKGKLAINFLLKRKWKVLYSGYQTILVRR